VYHGNLQLIEADAKGRAVARAWQEMLEMQGGRVEADRPGTVSSACSQAARAEPRGPDESPRTWGVEIRCTPLSSGAARWAVICPGRRHGGAVDIQRAADLYAQGRTPYQVGAELGVTATTVDYQLMVTRVWLDEGSTALIHRCRPSAYTTPPFLAFIH
jgi:hypothetical protein